MGTEITIKNLFISHYGEDDEHVQNFKGLLASKDYQVRNSSIDSTKTNDASNEDYIKQLLRDGISWASTVIVLIGPKTHERWWVNWEIEQAHNQEKRIIGVFIHGATDSDVPPNLNLYGHGLVTWTSEKIIDAIEGKNVGWCNTNGTPRNNVWSISRSDC